MVEGWAQAGREWNAMRCFDFGMTFCARSLDRCFRRCETVRGRASLDHEVRFVSGDTQNFCERE
jgi:hypothetical protein